MYAKYGIHLMEETLRRLDWIASSRKDMRELPEDVQDALGFQLYLAQLGQVPPRAKPTRGFHGAGVESIDDSEGDTYRAIYTVRFEDSIYVLHFFQKKSKRGISTPRQDIDLIRSRLALAEQAQTEWKKAQK